MTIIWHPASSAARVAVALGSRWAAGLHCHVVGHVVTWQALTRPQPPSGVTGSNNNNRKTLENASFIEATEDFPFFLGEIFWEDVCPLL